MRRLFVKVRHQGQELFVGYLDGLCMCIGTEADEQLQISSLMFDRSGFASAFLILGLRRQQKKPDFFDVVGVYCLDQCRIAVSFEHLRRQPASISTFRTSGFEFSHAVMSAVFPSCLSVHFPPLSTRRPCKCSVASSSRSIRGVCYLHFGHLISAKIDKHRAISTETILDGDK